MKPVKVAVLAAMTAIVLAMAACAEQPPASTPTSTPQSTPQPTPTSVPAPVPTPTPWDQEPRPQYATGTPFSLKVGQSAEVDGGGLLVHLSEVTNDSRCPADVVCVWAGDVTVVLEMATYKAASIRAEVKFQGNRPAIDHGTYRIVVTDVQPYPYAAGTPIAAADYVVSLIVEDAAS